MDERQMRGRKGRKEEMSREKKGMKERERDARKRL